MNVTDKSTAGNFYTMKVGLFGASLIVICFIFIHITWAVTMRPFWEAVGIALYLFIFLQIQAVKSYILDLPKPVIKAYFIFFAIFCICHCISIPRTTFPFVAWNMYSDESHLSKLVNFFRYEATTISGRKVSLKPEVYFRSLASGRIITDLDNLTKSIVFYDPKAEQDLLKRKQLFMNDYARKQGGIKSFLSWLRLTIYEENLFTLDEKKQHLNEVLKAIALRYDAWHPGDPLNSVDIIKGTIDISQGPQAKATFSNVWHYSFVQGGQ